MTTPSKRLPPFRPELRAAIRAGRKTVTRRIVKPQPPADCTIYHNSLLNELRWMHEQRDEGGALKYHLGVGDRVHLIEPLEMGHAYGHGPCAYYRDGIDPVMVDGEPLRWRWGNDTLSSIHMPTEAARWFGRITEIRVERVQSITEEDAIAEGITAPRCLKCGYTRLDCGLQMDHRICGEPEPDSAIPLFRDLWEKINGADSWQRNDWVWLIRWEAEG